MPRANRVAVMHGPNLDQLGSRDPAHYGELDLGGLERQIDGWANELNLSTIFFQTNHEGEFIEYLHRAPERCDGLIVNAGAWSHYSWAIRDALEFTGLPAVEVHLSDISKREKFRKVSVFDGLVLDKIYGEKEKGYERALKTLAAELKDGE
jgi:3-dehydroquinate dehydratase II